MSVLVKIVVVMVLYIIEKVHGGLFGGGIPPNGQVQMIVGGKCEYKIFN